MKRITTGLIAIGFGVASVLAGASAAVANGGHGDAVAVQDTDPRALAAARAASAKYHDVDAAIADGFQETEECASLPGAGGMGYHFVNMANLLDGVFDVTKPEMLLYVPTKDGLRLAGVEFMKFDADQDLGTDDDRPSLFGVPFDGPMPGHGPGMPVHYDLHVWLWVNNPEGVFAPWNPRVACGES